MDIHFSLSEMNSWVGSKQVVLPFGLITSSRAVCYYRSEFYISGDISENHSLKIVVLLVNNFSISDNSTAIYSNTE